MTKGSLQESVPDLDRVRAKTQQILDTLRQLVATGDIDPALIQRGMLELLAARTLRSRRNTSLDEALDSLTRELDINCLLLLPENEILRSELEKVLAQFNLDAQSADQNLTIIELFQPDGRTREDQVGIFGPPDWLAKSLASLAIPGEPLLCLDCGDSTLAPRLLLYQAQSRSQGVEFATLDRNPEVVGNLRLMISLVVDDLEQVRESVLFDEEWVDNPQQLFDAPRSSLGSRQFGTILINLLAPAYSKPRHRAELNRSLPAFLSQRLMPDGRALLLGPSILLDGLSWGGFRADAQRQLHVESIVDLSPGAQVFADIPLISLSLIALRQPQQAITRSVTVLAPSNPHEPTPAPADLLDDLVAHLELEEQHPFQRGSLFERPTSELLADRWDPKFYCPARLALQDELISAPQATWLGGVAQFIAQGSHPSLFVPYPETRVAGVTFEGRQETIAHLKIGDQVRLRREVDHPHDPNAVHVERRSGASVGYLPAELAAEMADPIDDLGGEHWGTVTQIRSGTDDHPTWGITVRFAPPQYARVGEPVPMIRPGDITNNRLAGRGEIAWLLHEHQDKVTRLQAGDVLLLLRGFGTACVVPREFEGAVCHRDFAIIRPSEEVDPLYLLSSILSAEFQEQLRFVARGAPLPRVDLPDLEELLVIVPPLATQRRIALAFAESQGELGAGRGEGVARWLDLVQGDQAVDQQRVTSSLLSNLFSDWDRMHSLEDWLRLKDEYVRDLRNPVAHGRSPFGDESLNAAILALGMLNHEIGQVLREPGRPVAGMQRVERALAEFRERAGWVESPFLRARLSMLARKLAELLHAESTPLPVQFHLEQAVLPAGVPTLLRLAVINEGERALDELEVVPRLLSGEIVERPPWRLEWLDSGGTHAFEARVRFPRSETARIECAVSYTQEDGAPVQRTVQLAVEVVPAEQAPFAPIQPNPYITGGAVDAPEMFFGREDVLDFLSTNLIGAHQSNVIILQGNRRTGKSSILKQVVNRDLFAPHIPVFVDCQGLGALTDQRFFYKLAREIWKALAKRSDVDAPPQVERTDISEDDPFYDFQEVLSGFAAGIPGRRLILLIDEFELIDSAIRKGELSPIALENLRHLFQHRHDLAVVLTGSYRLTLLRQEYWSILFGLGLKHEVGFLDERAARQLITQPLGNIVTYADEAIERIIQLTACHPYFVQVVCHNLVNVLNEQRTTYVTQSDVEVAAQETLTSADGHMRFMFDSAGSRAWQAVLVYMASSLSQPGALPGHEIEGFVESHRLPVSRVELERALRDLADRDVVHVQGAMGQRRYGFKIDLVRQWIRRNYDLRSAIALAQDASYVREG